MIGGVPYRVRLRVGGEQRRRAASARPARGRHEAWPAPPARRARRLVPAVAAAFKVQHPMVGVAAAANVISENITHTFKIMNT